MIVAGGVGVMLMVAVAATSMPFFTDVEALRASQKTSSATETRKAGGGSRGSMWSNLGDSAKNPTNSEGK